MTRDERKCWLFNTFDIKYTDPTFMRNLNEMLDNLFDTIDEISYKEGQSFEYPFKIGQTVYYLRDNKIVSSKVDEMKHFIWNCSAEKWRVDIKSQFDIKLDNGNSYKNTYLFDSPEKLIKSCLENFEKEQNEN